MKEIKAKYLGNIYQTSKDGYDGAIFSARYISRTLTARNSGGVMVILVYDEQNKSIRKDIVNTIVTDGSSPKHNPRVIEVSGGGDEIRHTPSETWVDE